MASTLMIYGAYGYTGEMMVHEAVSRGLQPIIAGRSKAKLAPLAKQYCLESRVFDTVDIGENLKDVDVLLNCAGPFMATAPSMVEACLQHQIHYIDITGEIPVFQYCHTQDQRAKAAGVLMCPGAGFDIVPTDCLAASLKERLPDANRIDLGFNFGTRPSIGTIKTAIEGAATGGLIRKDYQLVPVPQGYRLRKMPFPSGNRWGVSFPWGDVFTSGVSTNTPNGIVYATMPLFFGVFLRLTSFLKPLFANERFAKALQRQAERFLSGGPHEDALNNERTEFWAEASNAQGQHIAGHMSGPNVYRLTVDTALTIAQHCLENTIKTGYQTPSMLMGSDFFAKRTDVKTAYF
ncbi:saccharopine dehydrogenase NADP-binding domain-containing protein [Shewanella alkalitolerans]|uniref:saccharopine dehydrogenase family protein n=1 Tax=Shewanella alkalitolerans TaxID=2864209 RepID=UPI001C655586|nr:saccharopine dehydrogenase NADP-binding domain-containing protein [Shewanella alkalitolerans]QYJ99240.1 saccharopine dehydrogenase NADP-binding domain-containing protein [Shewanella alkalitolerans]